MGVQYSSYSALGTSIETAEITAGAVTAAKLASMGAMIEVGSDTLTGADSVIEVTGLDLDTDGVYIGYISCEAAANGVLGIYLNSDSTATNYYAQEYNVNNAAIAGSRGNAFAPFGLNAGENAVIWFMISPDVDGYPRILWFSNMYAVASLQIRNCYCVRNNTANVTSIHVYNNGSNFSAGSKLVIYKPN